MNKKKIIFVNSITLSRVVMVIPIFFIANLHYLFAVALWAGLSDFLDGFLARKWQLNTAFGLKIDQYADKLTSFVFLIFFFNNQQLSYLFVALILSREILLLIFRRLNLSNAQSHFVGKAKTFFLYALFIYLSAQHLMPILFFDFKMILMLLVIICSWLSFFLSIEKFTQKLIYGLGTTGLLATLVKNAPGTITSLAVFLLLFFGLNGIGLEYKIVVFLILLIIHFANYYSFLKQVEAPNDDPSIYTLDETLAIAMAWLFVGELSIVEVVILFVMFRFFDILKPLGIQKIESQLKWSAAIRNIADDVLAMVYALIIFQGIKIYVV